MSQYGVIVFGQYLVREQLQYAKILHVCESANLTHHQNVSEHSNRLRTGDF